MWERPDLSDGLLKIAPHINTVMLLNSQYLEHIPGWWTWSGSRVIVRLVALRCYIIITFWWVTIAVAWNGGCVWEVTLVPIRSCFCSHLGIVGARRVEHVNGLQNTSTWYYPPRLSAKLSIWSLYYTEHLIWSQYRHHIRRRILQKLQESNKAKSTFES